MILLLAAAHWLAPPLSDLYPSPDYPFYPSWSGYVSREPLEATRFLIAIAVPGLLAAVVLRWGTPGPGSARLTIPLIAIQLAVFLRGAEAQVVAAASEKGPVDVTFTLDDSVSIVPASTALGRFEGPKEFLTLPASALLEGADLLKVAGAQRIIVNAGPAPVKLSNDERREIRALIRVAACSQ